MTDDRYPIDRLVDFAAGVLEALDVLPDHARTCALRLVEADARGRDGHGLIRLPQYALRIRAGGYNLRPEITVVRDSPVSALVDGDNALGQVVMTQAAGLAVDKALAHGIGWVGTVRSNHAGAAGIYPAMALSRGLGALYCAVANGNGMPPWGGRERLLGTNPIAFAIPAGDEVPFQLDIATTVASHGTIKVKAQAGEKLPEGWVVDEHGSPITDPGRVSEGFLMPIGGYKGAGLNVMIGLLAGVMNGAAFGREVVPFQTDHESPTNTGQMMLAFRPDLFMDRLDFEAVMDAKLAELRSSEPAGAEPIMLPGEMAVRREAAAREEGVVVPVGLRERLVDLARSVGVEPL